MKIILSKMSLAQYIFQTETNNEYQCQLGTAASEDCHTIYYYKSMSVWDKVASDVSLGQGCL
jgi:hypothetical protein